MKMLYDLIYLVKRQPGGIPRMWCPICNEIRDCRESIIKVNHEYISFQLVACDVCGIIMRYPPMAPKRITEYYSSGYVLSNYQNDLEKTFQAMKPIAEHRLMYIERLGLSHNATILEIGPGSGTLLAMLNSRGYSAVGVEPDRVAATWLKEKKGLNIHEGFFEKLLAKGMFEQYVGYFDLVVVTNVLEHIPKPAEFLRNLRRLLTYRGLLFVEVPNVLRPYSDGWRWQRFCDPGHLYYYSPRTLEAVLTNGGYVVESMATDEFDPYFPLFCVARASSVGTEKSFSRPERSSELVLIRKAWWCFVIKHYIYHIPRRIVGPLIRRFMRRNICSRID